MVSEAHRVKEPPGTETIFEIGPYAAEGRDLQHSSAAAMCSDRPVQFLDNAQLDLNIGSLSSKGTT